MCRIPRIASWPAVAIAAAVWLGAIGGVPAAPAADEAAVDAFLARLGLVDLQIRLHEQTLERDSNGPAQRATARRLADLYAAALLAAEAPERADELRRRVARLLERVPDASTSALQVSLAQADYQRAEKLVLAWLEDPRARESRVEAGKILEKIAPVLDGQQKALQASVERLAGQLERAPSESARADLDAQWQREQGVAARAGYLAAWAHYYAGLCAQPNPLADPHFQAARRLFREVLGLGDVKDYAEVDQEALALEPLARARAAVGLGLAEAAMGQAFEADLVFRWLEGATVNPTIREQADYWRLQSRLSVWRWNEALEVASERASALGGTATSGKVSFFVALVRTAYVVPPEEGFGGAPRDAREIPDAMQRRRFGELGLQGLLRLRQITLLRELVSRYEIPVDANAALPLVWARADQLFRDAEQNHEPVQYQQVAQLLATALARPEAAGDVATAGRCRWTLAWCRYRLKEFDAAAKLFQQSSAALREIDSKIAVEAAWMAFASYQQLLAEQPTARAAAIDALHSLQRDFPNTPRAQQASLQLARLQQSAESPEDALRTLAKIKPDDPQFATARYEICRLHHQLWAKAAKAGGGAGQGGAAQVFQAVDEFLTLQSQRPSPTADDDQRTLKAGLLALDVLSSDESADATARGARYVQNLQACALRLPATSTILAEYQYRRLQLAQRQADDEQAHAAAEWLTRNATGSPYEATALVLWARRVDEQIAKAGDADLPALQREAARVYTRLVALWGDSPQAISAKKNTFVANSKLAQYLLETGQYGDAATRLGKLLAAYPQDKSLLRRAAQAEQRSGQSAAALDKWRTLLAGLEKGSYDWLEAKLGQMECLADVDPAMAKQVFEQFRGLYPELGGADWRARFEQLERRLSGRTRTPK